MAATTTANDQHEKLFLIEKALETGRNIAIIGPHGIGKTQAVRTITREKLPQYKMVYISLAQMSKDDLLVPMPVEKHGRKMVQYLPLEIFDDMCEDGVQRPVILVMDEFNRNISDPQLYNALLEFMSVGTLAGVPLNIHCFVALMNPNDDDTYFNTSELEAPVIDRFDLFVPVDQYDLGADMYLLNNYEEAGGVIEWYLSLPADLKKEVPPRRQEKVIVNWRNGMGVYYSFPRTSSLPLTQLEQILSGGNIWTLKRLINQPQAAAEEIRQRPAMLPLFVALLRLISATADARKVKPLLKELPPYVLQGLGRYSYMWSKVISELAEELKGHKARPIEL